MKEETKKILRTILLFASDKMRGVFGWVKKNKNWLFLCFILLGFILCCFSVDLFLEILSLKFIQLFLIFFFFVSALWMRIREGNKQLLVSTASIIVVILVFLLQNFEANERKIQQDFQAKKKRTEFIDWINEYNCKMVIDKGIKMEELKDKAQYHMSESIMIKSYIENMDFIYNEIGTTTAQNIGDNLEIMEIMNENIAFVKELDIALAIENNSSSAPLIREEMKKRNEWIIGVAKELKNYFCKPLNY